jgi:hypothetical protein
MSIIPEWFNRATVNNWNLGLWAHEIHQWARRKQWWDVIDGKVVVRNLLELLMLATTELAEAAEEVRNGMDVKAVYAVDIMGKRVPYGEALAMSDAERLAVFGKPLPKPEGFGIEVGDTIIRLLDTAGALGIDIAECMRLKMAYNETRPARHGGKTA